MDLHKFNSKLLGCIGIADETGKGHLSRVMANGSSIPFTIGGKRVVLPTKENLRSPEDNTIVFHPLSENITRSESEVLKAMRDTIMYQLTVRSVTLLTEMARVAATPSEHKRLDAASQRYMKKLGDFDERAYETVRKGLVRVGPEPEKRLISIALRKGKQADGVLRRASYKFPVLDSVLGDDPDLLGVKYPSKKARQAIRTLFEVVLGDETTRASFDYGSKNLTAPYFDALMNAFFNMANHLNQVIETHRKLLGKAIDSEGNVLDHDAADDLLFDLSWYEGMDNLVEMRKLVPPQEGNEGNIIVQAPKEKEDAPARVAERIAPPRDRAPAPSRQESRPEPEDLPWDTDDRAAPVIRSEHPVLKRKSLDDFGRRDERGTRDRYDDRDRHYDDRRDSRDSRDRYYDDRRDSRDSRDYRRDERPPVRRIDLGLDTGRDRYDDRRDFRRDDRGPARREFGGGTPRTMRF